MLFNVFSHKKIGVTTAIMLFVDDKLDEEVILMISDELEVQNWTFQYSFSWRRLSLLTSGQQWVSCLHYMSWTTVHAD